MLHAGTLNGGIPFLQKQILRWLVGFKDATKSCRHNFHYHVLIEHGKYAFKTKTVFNAMHKSVAGVSSFP